MKKGLPVLKDCHNFGQHYEQNQVSACTEQHEPQERPGSPAPILALCHNCFGTH